MAIRSAKEAKAPLSARMATKVKSESDPEVARSREKKVAIPDLVKKDGQRFNDDLYKQIEHLSRLSKITGMNYGSGLKLETMQALEKRGFVWFVDHQFVSRFEYAAAMTQPKGNANCAVRQDVTDFRHTDVRFKGDVPDWVLDRMEQAIECGMDTITVHSHYPLPVKLEKIQTDPVAVAWKGTPSIQKSGKGRFGMSDKHKQGVVIAIWQGENEVGGDVL